MYRLLFLSFALLPSFAVERDAPSNEATAQVTILKGYKGGGGLGAANLQRHWMTSDKSCAKWHKIATFNSFTGSNTIKKIPAGNVSSFQAEIVNYTYGSRAICTNYYSFTPLKGHEYVITQETIVYDTCKVNVVDSATGSPPPDLIPSRNCPVSQ